MLDKEARTQGLEILSYEAGESKRCRARTEGLELRNQEVDIS